jgi:hypothetical protein
VCWDSTLRGVESILVSKAISRSRPLDLSQALSSRDGIFSAFPSGVDQSEPSNSVAGIFANAADICSAILNPSVDSCTVSAYAENYVIQEQKESMVLGDVWVDELTHLPSDKFQESLGAVATAVAKSPWTIDDRTDDAVEFILAQCAPCELMNGALLQNFCAPSNSHEEVASLIHRAHALQVGDGCTQFNSANLFRQLLQRNGLHFPEISSEKFFVNRDVIASSWNLPAYQLSLSLFPRRFEAELLGAALFDVTEVMARPLHSLADDRFDGIGDSLYVKKKRAIQSELREVIREAISRTMEQWDDEHAAVNGTDTSLVAYRKRILTGFWTSATLLNAWLGDLSALLDSDYLGPRNAMIRLIEQKGIHAVGYHEKLKVDAVPFDQLIVENPAAFVHALERSRWISPGHPEKSLLTTKLIQFGGPMFRVFSDHEIETIRRWITSIPRDVIADNAAPNAVGCCSRGGAQSSGTRYQRGAVGGNVPPQSVRRTRSSSRSMYTRLLNNEQDPAIYDEARDFVKSWLARSAEGISRDDRAIPFANYSHSKLRNWFEGKATSQLRDYEQSERSVQKTRDEVIDEALQLCPMIFIDGAWLQKWGNVGLVESPIGSHLFKIYADEIGNGNSIWNHPNIYRKLVEQMGVELPDFRKPEFAEWNGFRSAAFDVPVFWLSLSLFPRAYLPETLGLNLAMELSGVGGSYKTAHDELKHYGFSTLFVDLHNTIDNVSTGHSALALEAIELHMDEALRGGDNRMVAERWRRVWTGYRALTPRTSRWTEIFKPATYIY